MSSQASIEEEIRFLELDTGSAIKWAGGGKIEEWVHRYLLTGKGGRTNPEFSEGLKREKRWWNGPVELNLTDLSPAVGTDPGLEYVVDKDYWFARTSAMAKSFSNPLSLPPLIIEASRWAAAPMITMMNLNKEHLKLLATLLYSLLFFVGCSSFPASPTIGTPARISAEKVLGASTNTAVATPEILAPTPSQIVATEQPYHCIFIDDWKEPSGAWAALSVQCQNPGSPRVEVLSFDRKHWNFELPEYDTRYAYFLYKWSYQWEGDPQYLYFYSALTWPWDSEWNKYQPARGLFRMNLSNGETDIILDEKEYHPYNTVSLSPDEQSIVYLSLHTSNKVIGIRNIQTAEEKTAFIDGFDDGGNFLWSPSKQKIAFVLSNLKYDDYGFAFPEKEIVFVLDTNTMALEQVYSADTNEKTIEPISWEGQNLVIKNRRYDYLISIDLETGKETKFFPTPTPTP